MGLASRAARAWARTCVCCPRLTVLAWAVLLALVVIVLAFTPITLDAGVDAFRVRRNLLADRHNAYTQLTSRFLESAHDDTNSPRLETVLAVALKDTVQAIIDSRTGSRGYVPAADATTTTTAAAAAASAAASVPPPPSIAPPSANATAATTTSATPEAAPPSSSHGGGGKSQISKTLERWKRTITSLVSEHKPVHRESGIGGDGRGRDELHLLLYRDNGGNVLGRHHIQRMCELKQKVVQHPDYSSVCLLVNNSDVQSENLPNDVVANLTQQLKDLASNSTSATAATAVAVADAAASDGDPWEDIGVVPPPVLKLGTCTSTWSLLDLRGAYWAVGLGPVVDFLVALARSPKATSSIPEAIEACTQIPPEEEAAVRGGAAALDPGAAAAAASGVNPGAWSSLLARWYDPDSRAHICDFLRQIRPTPDELADMARLPDDPLDANGCDGIAAEDFQGMLMAGATMLKWAKRGGMSTKFLGLPMGYLVDTYFATLGAPSVGSNITRLVFRLDHRRARNAKQLLASLDNGAAATESGTLAPTNATNATVGGGPRTDAPTRGELEKEASVSPVDFTFDMVSTVLNSDSGHPARLGGDLRVVWRGWDYFDRNALRQVLTDAAWALGSLLFVTIYLWAHTCSLVQALGGVLGILASFPVAVFLYRLVFRISWIGALHFTGVFVILGIGADDIFVICEHWRQSATAVPFVRAASSGTPSKPSVDADTRDRMVTRMAWTLRHSVSAILATSATTAVAFAANCISTIAPIRLFGLFMALLIAANLLLVITLLPALIVINETSRGSRLCTWVPWLRRRRDAANQPASLTTNALFDTRPSYGGGVVASAKALFGLRPKAPLSLFEEADEGIASGALHRPSSADAMTSMDGSDLDVMSNLTAMRYDAEADFGAAGGGARLPSAGASPGSPATPSSPTFDEGLGASLAAKVGRFFGGRFADNVIRYRRAFVLILGVLVAVLPYLMTKLPGPTDRPSLFPPWHNQNLYFAKELQFSAGAEADSVTVKVVFGAKARDDGRISNPYDLGTFAWDEQFDVADPRSQAWLLRMCEDLDGPGLAGHVRPGTVSCWTKSFDRWLRNRGFRGEELSLPLDRAAFNEALHAWWLLGAEAGYSAGLLWGTESGEETEGRLKTLGCPGPDCGRMGREPVAAGGDVLRGSYIQFTTRTPYQRELPLEQQEWRFWEQWTEGQLVAAPPGLRGGFQTSVAWVLMSTDNSMRSTAWQSLTLSMALALGVLLVATRNLWLSVLSCLCISGVASCFLSFMLAAGWSLGPVESISMTVLIGLSVDYIVHIAIAYGGCTAWGREARSRYALRSMGAAIIAGAATTIGAALFLLACVCIFFTRFGTFVTVTLCAALVHALVMLPALLAQAGPQGVSGAIETDANARWRIWRFIRRWLHLPQSANEEGWQRVNDIANIDDVDIDGEGGSIARVPLSDADGIDGHGGSVAGGHAMSDSLWSDPGPSASVVAAAVHKQRGEGGGGDGEPFHFPSLTTPYVNGNGPFTAGLRRGLAGDGGGAAASHAAPNQTWFRLARLGGFFVGDNDASDGGARAAPDADGVELVEQPSARPAGDGGAMP